MHRHTNSFVLLDRVLLYPKMPHHLSLIERMFSEENTAFYAAQLVLALEHLHSLGIIYRDLKPENIMLNAHGDIVLTDFGLSKVPLDSDGRTGTVCGTIEYMAPEVISERFQYDRTVDWWSLGIVIHDMLTGSPPFIANNRKKTMDAIMNKKLNLPYYLSMDAKDLLGSFSSEPLPADWDMDLMGLRISRTIDFSARSIGNCWLCGSWNRPLCPFCRIRRVLRTSTPSSQVFPFRSRPSSSTPPSMPTATILMEARHFTSFRLMRVLDPPLQALVIIPLLAT